MMSRSVKHRNCRTANIGSWFILRKNCLNDEQSIMRDVAVHTVVECFSQAGTLETNESVTVERSLMNVNIVASVLAKQVV